MDIAFLFGSMIILILLGVPIGIVVGIVTVATISIFSDIPLAMVSQNAFAGIDSFPLMAIPFFILAGSLMSSGGVARRILDVASILVGSVTGGLGMVATLASMFFAAISGSAVATVSAIGKFMIPAMKEKDYDTGFSTAITATAGTIGVIIPPSVPFVIYGVVTNTSIGDLFKAGLIPGILMGIGIMFVCYIWSRKKGYKGTSNWNGVKEFLKTLNDAKWALLAPVIILGGIYGGIFTPTEAAVVAVVYSFVIGVFVYKELTWKGLYECLIDTIVINGITSFMIGLTMVFAMYLSMEQIPTQITALLTSITSSKIILLLLINVFLLIVGCLIDNIPATIILSPVLLPIVVNLGISPVHFGVILVMNLAIGFVTPPYGVNLFVASAISGLTLEEIIKWIWPFIAVLIVVLLLVTYIPWFSMCLVNVL